jgi:hypothetical protein
MAAAWAVSRDGLLILLTAVALFRSFVGASDERSDTRTFVEFAVLVVALTALTLIPVPLGL